jgi:mono/diheme cytochrome c family protein
MTHGWRNWLLAGITAGFAVICSGLLGGCRQVAPPTPLSALNAQQTHGRGVFQAHCSACHYDRRNEPLHGPSLLGVFKKPALPSGAPANDERVTNTIVHGHNLMPALGDSVDPMDRDDLLAYLHTL